MKKMNVKMIQRNGGLYYPQIVTNEVIDVTETLCKRNCLFQRGTLLGVLSDVGEEMKRQLLEGNIVNLPGIGKFYPVAIGKGVRKEQTLEEPEYTLKFSYRMEKDKIYKNLLSELGIV